MNAKDCANLRLSIERFGKTSIDNSILLELLDLAESTFDWEDRPKGSLRQEIDDLENVVRDLESSIRALQRMNR